MKKLLSILLSAMLALACFACAKPKKTNYSPNALYGFIARWDTIIRDNEGKHYCFWNDGQIWYNYLIDDDSQTKKSATLSTQIEYDLCIYLGPYCVEQLYYNFEFEYDTAKIEITSNPDKENHFKLKVLQLCKNEKIIIHLVQKRSDAHARFPVTVSSAESDTPVE